MEASNSHLQATDADATLARLSAIRKGYIEDPFTRHLVPRPQLQLPRPPLINIGTHIRCKSIDAAIQVWLHWSSTTTRQCQIISLGAGSDTRFWRIASSQYSDVLSTYVELDFPEVTAKKAMLIKKSKELSSPLNALNSAGDDIVIANGGSALHSAKYHLLAADLRLPTSSSLEQLRSILKPDCPTLVLCECVLVYMSPSQSSSIIQWFTNFFDSTPLGILVYEMFKLNDPFGKMMKNNLKMRMVELPGAEPFQTIEDLQHRFDINGFTKCTALTLKEVKERYVTEEERQRISALELLDEVEELNILLDHYALSWAVKVPSNSGAEPWLDWDLAPITTRT